MVTTELSPAHASGHAPATAMKAAGGSPRTVVAARAARAGALSGAMWGVIFGIYVAVSALRYEALYATDEAKALLAATFEANVGTAAIIGPAYELASVAGFTEWRGLGGLSIVGAVWGLLTSARLLRGEEESGRWEVLLAGQTTPRGAAAQAVAGLGAGLAALWAVTALLVVAVGQTGQVRISAGDALFFAVTLVASSAVFLAVGALTSQLAATRRQAASYGGAVLGLSYAVRLVADSGAGLEWLRWASPLGWVELTRPLTAPRPLALLPVLALVAVASGLTIHLAGRRDLDGSVLPDRATARPRLRLLGGPTGLTVRLSAPVLVAWQVAVAALAVITGLVAKAAGTTLVDSPGFGELLSRLGGSGGGAKAYLGVVFLIFAALIALMAAGQASAVRAEEAEGRLDHLVVRPVARASWFAGRVAVAALGVLVAGPVIGLAAWLGLVTQDAGVSAADMVVAGVNLTAPGLLLLGIAVAVFGLWPRATTVVTYAVLVWSFLLELIGGVVDLNHWLRDVSIFHHITPAPAADPNWASACALVSLGLALAVVGGTAFVRRDLAGL